MVITWVLGLVSFHSFSLWDDTTSINQKLLKHKFFFSRNFTTHPIPPMKADTPDKKKTGLSILLAIGKKKPTDEKPSYESSDEGAAAGGNEDEGAEPESEETGEDQESTAGQELTLPKGFKPPTEAQDGEPFTTTIRGKIVDGKLEVLAVGDVPMHSEEAETPEEEESESPEEESAEQETGTEEPQGPGMTASMPPARAKGGKVKSDMPQHRLDQMKSLKKKAMDELAAKKIFQPGR